MNKFTIFLKYVFRCYTIDDDAKELANELKI